MTKTTIEINREKDFTSGAGRMFERFYGDDAPAVLDALTAWTCRPENVGQKVYRHSMYRTEENVREEPHQWGNGSGYTYSHKCDLVIYLDIYHQ